MVWGAVILGKDYGSGSIGNFTRYQLEELKSNVRFPLWTEKPFDVTQRDYLTGTSGMFKEGVLVNVCAGEESVGDFEKAVEEKLIISAVSAYNYQSACMNKMRIDRGYVDNREIWLSGFNLDTFAWLGREDGENIWKPYFDIVEVYSNEGHEERYKEIAEDLFEKSFVARNKNTKRINKEILENDLCRLSM